MSRDFRQNAAMSRLEGDGRPMPALGTSPAVVHEDGGVGLILTGMPFATEGDTLDEAAADMVDALREYAQGWPRLSQAPNHSATAALVTFVGTSTDDELTVWLCGRARATRPVPQEHR